MMTRYQILFPSTTGETPERPIENFTAAEKTLFIARCKALRAQGVRFTTWDTQKNELSKLLSFSKG
jgi:hypothetical protein